MSRVEAKNEHSTGGVPEWSLAQTTAKWVTRSGEYSSKFSEKGRFDEAAKFLARRTVDSPESGENISLESIIKGSEACDSLISALQYAKCSLEHDVRQKETVELAMALLRQKDVPNVSVTLGGRDLFAYKKDLLEGIERANGEILQEYLQFINRSGTGKLASELASREKFVAEKMLALKGDLKISYEQLQISLIKGPNSQTEMSVSFPGTIDQAEEADEQLENFVAFVSKDIGTLREGEKKGRRVLQIGDERIGLPDKHVFTKGIRFKVLGTGGGAEPRIVLDKDLMDTIPNESSDFQELQKDGEPEIKLSQARKLAGPPIFIPNTPIATQKSDLGASRKRSATSQEKGLIYNENYKPHIGEELFPVQAECGASFSPGELGEHISCVEKGRQVVLREKVRKLAEAPSYNHYKLEIDGAAVDLRFLCAAYDTIQGLRGEENRNPSIGECFERLKGELGSLEPADGKRRYARLLASLEDFEGNFAFPEKKGDVALLAMEALREIEALRKEVCERLSLLPLVGRTAEDGDALDESVIKLKELRQKRLNRAEQLAKEAESQEALGGAEPLVDEVELQEESALEEQIRLRILGGQSVEGTRAALRVGISPSEKILGRTALQREGELLAIIRPPFFTMLNGSLITPNGSTEGETMEDKKIKESLEKLERSDLPNLASLVKSMERHMVQWFRVNMAIVAAAKRTIAADDPFMTEKLWELGSLLEYPANCDTIADIAIEHYAHALMQLEEPIELNGEQRERLRNTFKQRLDDAYYQYYQFLPGEAIEIPTDTQGDGGVSGQGGGNRGGGTVANGLYAADGLSVVSQSPVPPQSHLTRDSAVQQASPVGELAPEERAEVERLKIPPSELIRHGSQLGVKQLYGETMFLKVMAQKNGVMTIVEAHSELCRNPFLGEDKLEPMEVRYELPLLPAQEIAQKGFLSIAYIARLTEGNETYNRILKDKNLAQRIAGLRQKARTLSNRCIQENRQLKARNDQLEGNLAKLRTTSTARANLFPRPKADPEKPPPTDMGKAGARGEAAEAERGKADVTQASQKPRATGSDAPGGE